MSVTEGTVPFRLRLWIRPAAKVTAREEDTMNSPQRGPGEKGTPTQLDDTSRGALGARLVATEAFHGHDPDTTALPCISRATPTKCQARTRLYRNGQLELEGFPVADISDYVTDQDVTVWLDLRDPDYDDLGVLSEEFGLHPLAVEDAGAERQRPKLDRYRTHLFLTAYAVKLDTGTGRLAASEIDAFITDRALITIRKDDGLDIGAVVERWDADSDLAKFGVSYLLHGLLDYIVDGHFEAVQGLDDAVETLEDDLFADAPMSMQVQRHSFELRKSLVLLRRIVIPMREVVNSLMRRDLHVVADYMIPYYQDVYDHVLRAADWTDSLRDLVTTIRETNLTIQGNRLGIITKKVTSWAAIVAVPTLVTGYYGMNVPYPGFDQKAGLYTALGIMVVAAVLLYVVFKRKDWL
jgi:magnesium transporter